MDRKTDLIFSIAIAFGCGTVARLQLWGIEASASHG